jgi:hypothetical protein
MASNQRISSGPFPSANLAIASLASAVTRLGTLLRPPVFLPRAIYTEVYFRLLERDRT